MRMEDDAEYLYVDFDGSDEEWQCAIDNLYTLLEEGLQSPAIELLKQYPSSLKVLKWVELPYPTLIGHLEPPYIGLVSPLTLVASLADSANYAYQMASLLFRNFNADPNEPEDWDCHQLKPRRVLERDPISTMG
ncbi:hypothetical protein HDU97_005106 [Phlyctochytrium planicorne]|nr:hypothetical protein HDU97_005106 [Phlyctochytrium planicorne]